MLKVLLAAFLTVFAASAASAEVRVTMHDGRVTVVAKDATVRQILTEWARVGQTKVVNIERIPGGPISIELTDVPEAQALDILLRSISGYMAVPRPTPVASLSHYDRILVTPTPVAARAASAPVVPAFQPPPDDASDDQGPVNAGRPVFTFPTPNAPAVINPPAQAPQGFAPGVGVGGVTPAPISGPTPTTIPALFPGAPTTTAQPSAASGGTSTPGAVAPAPAQPGQPAQR